MSEDEVTVKGLIFTKDSQYDVFLPADLALQLADAGDREGWVELALVNSDEYICLRDDDITFFRREMTDAEKQRRHTIL